MKLISLMQQGKPLFFARHMPWTTMVVGPLQNDIGNLCVSAFAVPAGANLFQQVYLGVRQAACIAAGRAIVATVRAGAPFYYSLSGSEAYAQACFDNEDSDGRCLQQSPVMSPLPEASSEPEEPLPTPEPCQPYNIDLDSSACVTGTVSTSYQICCNGGGFTSTSFNGCEGGDIPTPCGPGYALVSLFNNLGPEDGDVCYLSECNLQYILYDYTCCPCPAGFDFVDYDECHQNGQCLGGCP